MTHASEIFATKESRSEDQERIAELERMVGRLTMEKVSSFREYFNFSAGKGGEMRATASDRIGPMNIDLISNVEKLSSPNIIFVVYDARRLDDFSLSTRTRNTAHDTPFLEVLQNDALFFPNAISPGVWTLPVHSAMFSGLRVSTLQNDFTQENSGTFPDLCISVAELLDNLGYLTIAFPDHPYFYSGSNENTLIRGFRYFDIVMNYIDFEVVTNIGTPQNEIETRHKIKRNEFIISEEIVARIVKFNQEKESYDEKALGDVDEATGIVYPKIKHLYEKSPYFGERYVNEFEELLSRKLDNPVFMFFNLHMCAGAVPDRRLLSAWKLLFLLLNAQRQGKKLTIPRIDEDFEEYFERNLRTLCKIEPWRIQQHFDNRFYDITFETLCNYLEKHGILTNSVLVVTSDHGLSFSEHKEQHYLHGGARPYGYLVEVPLLIRFPEESKFRRFHGRYEERVSLVDVFYTILHIALGREIDIGKNVREYYRGRSLISRIENNDFDEAMITESMTHANYYDLDPYTRGEMIGLYYGKYKWMYSKDLRVCYRPVISSKNPIRSLWTWDNLRKVLMLLNPINILRPREKEFNLLFDVDKGEFAPISNPEIENVCKEIYNKYEQENVILGEGSGSPIWEKGDEEKILQTLRDLGYID